MPTKEINLIETAQAVSPEIASTQKMFKKVVPIVLAVYIFLLVSVLGYSFYLSTSLSSTQSAISLAKTEVEKLSKNEGLYLLLKQKAVSLTQIISGRYPYREYLEFFESFKSDATSISNIAFDGAHAVTLTVTLADSSVLDQFITKLLSEGKAKFSKIELGGVQRIPTGYSIGLTIQSKL